MRVLSRTYKITGNWMLFTLGHVFLLNSDVKQSITLNSFLCTSHVSCIHIFPEKNLVQDMFHQTSGQTHPTSGHSPWLNRDPHSRYSCVQGSATLINNLVQKCLSSNFRSNTPHFRSFSMAKSGPSFEV